MRRELRLFFTALTFLTRLPCARWAGNDEEDLGHAVRYFPLTGMLVGALAALVFWLVDRWMPQHIAVIASMIATLWVTGAFHEDGLADTADGLGGGWSKEQVLTIMKDSRIGSYGAIALVMGLLTKYATLEALTAPLLPTVLVAGHTLSRFAAVLLMRTQPYVRDTGKSKAVVQPLGWGALLFALVPVVFALLLLPAPSWWALLPVALVWLWFATRLRQRLGGYTGDCLGAMQQLCELTFYLGVLACSFT